MTVGDALLAFATAFAVSLAVTPVVGSIAARVGLVDQPGERGLSDRPTPQLGGVALLAGILVASALWLKTTGEVRGILGGAAIIVVVGAIDDAVDLRAHWKLLGQTLAALVPVLSGVVVHDFTLPFIHRVDLGGAAEPVTLLGLVALMNVVNFSDGIDGLAAGVCTISAVTFAIIAFDLGRGAAGVLAALTAGAALGFLVHNFHPASVFMGDSGSNLLGLMLGSIAVQGTLKTNALIALVGPLVILAVPFLDTGFVVAKRIKYRRPIYLADAEHFHHRFARIGFSQRRTVLYLYAWTLMLAGLALALRFIPYSNRSGQLHAGWATLMIALTVVAIAASFYLVYVLEILKFKRLRAWQLRRLDPGTAEHEIDATVERELETGEFEAVRPP
ncbi:MAG: undecaprenyl/decaprenyl-phosphate alpha-N-acetylglucosaminyl 1-phosphate transferase [Actinomycetota bacterium]|nr:undecaprenyl/decaprenyl-phosphate alpha-N-acetylglucosaminyl 1-phosphate transferase [Actinomycetota bacterium]